MALPGGSHSQSAVQRMAPRSHSVVVLASEGVQDLLARDRKRKVDLVPELEATPQPIETVAEEVVEPESTGKSSKSSRFKSRQQRRRDMLASDAAGGNGPKRCKDAIDAGLKLFQKGNYQAAIDSFNLALELPGNGAYRQPGSPREYLCPSDAEENAALYNMACCYAQMGQTEAALTCLEAVLENGFDDVKTMLADADLAPVRGPQLQQLVDKYTGIQAKVMGIFKKKDTIEADPNQSGPWWEVRW